MASAALVALLIAGSWWAKSGSTAVDYLYSIGVQSSSGLSESSGGLIGHVIDRAGWTLSDLGYIRGATLLALGLVAIVALVRWRRLGADEAAVIGWSLCCFALLATSNNRGSGFGLPLVVIAIVAIGVTLTRLPRKFAGGAAAIAVLAIVAGIADEVTGGYGSVLAGPVYRQWVADTGARATTDVEAVYQLVVREVGRQRVLLAHHDNLLNRNGLTWTAIQMPEVGYMNIVVPPCGPDGTAIAIRELPEVHYLIAGATKASCATGFGQRAVESAARRHAFRLVHTLKLGARNTVRLWRAGDG
jgi:hypothetical protein